MERQVAFRADASAEIGAGHVARCLSLAGGLATRGWRCTFFCRDLPGAMGHAIEGQGHRTVLLQKSEDEISAIAETHPEALIVDHYDLDAAWHDRLRRESGAWLLCIDDMADRPLTCDLLLDQNLGRTAADYDGLVPAGRPRLIGPDYALLRPEFAALRGGSLKRRAESGLGRILITMGGSDPGDATSFVLEALAAMPLPKDLQMDVVLGPAAPHVANVEKRLESMSPTAKLHIATDRMADLMHEADICIGAAGSTSWERCCLGLPSVIAVLAENQRAIAEALDAAGVAISAGHADAAGFRARLGEAMVALLDGERRQRMANIAAGVVDGRGVSRVCDAIERGLAR